MPNPQQSNDVTVQSEKIDPLISAKRRLISEHTDVSNAHPTGWFPAVVASYMMRAAFCNDATKQIAPIAAAQDELQNSATSKVAEDPVRAITKEMFVQLSKIDSSALEFGNRFELISNVLNGSFDQSSEDYCSALERILLVDSHLISEEAKSATIRYTTFLTQKLPLSRLTRVLVSALGSHSEAQSIAAARTLGEIADVGAIPLLHDTMRKTTSTQTAKEIKKAIKRIGDSNAASASP